MEKIKIKGVDIKTVSSYKILGLKAVAGKKYDREETTEAAEEAIRRTARVCTMQIPTKEKSG